MIELHGWLTIRATYENEDKIEVEEEKTIALVKELILTLKWNNIQLKTRNGVYYIETSIFSNRKTQEIDEINKFFKDVMSIAEGSYGMVYCWNDEDTNGKDNEFQVYIMAKGKIVTKDDVYLSPCIPTIENE